MPRLLDGALMGIYITAQLPFVPVPEPVPVPVTAPSSHARFGNDILPNFTALRIAYFAEHTKNRCCAAALLLPQRIP